MSQRSIEQLDSGSHLRLQSEHLARLKRAAEREVEVQAPSVLSPAYKRGRTLESSRWYMGSLLTFLAESKDTNNGFALLALDLKRGNEPPPHVHEREDELFYVLEGKMDGYVGPEVLHTDAGECFFIPKRAPHTFVIRSPRLRVLTLFSPGGAEKYFRTLSSPAETLDLPSNAVTYSQGTPEDAIRVAAELGTRFLSPKEIAEQLPHFPVSRPSPPPPSESTISNRKRERSQRDSHENFVSNKARRDPIRDVAANKNHA